MIYSAPIDSYTSEQGCESSFADAKHDFHTIFKAENIKGYVRANIPNYTGLTCESLTEDAFIDKHELNLSGTDSSHDHKSKPQFIPEHLNTSLKSRYITKHISRPQHQYNVSYSLLQEYFAEIGLIDDIFFICDVAYANVREDLKFANPTINSSQHFYWVQNAQTLYDPAGKTTWHSDKAYFEEDDEEFDEDGNVIAKSKAKSTASATTKIDCPNHFKKSDSKFLFCWQNAKKNIVTLYPEWSKTKFPTKEDSYKFSTNTPEQMLYTNKDLFLSIRSNDVNNYSTHDAYLIITNPLIQGYFGYADKILSAKGSGILSASELASYQAKGNDLKKFVKFINSNSTNPSGKSLFLDEVMNYSPEFQILAKKVGDASQSLSCCQKEINLQRFIDNVEGLKKPNNVEDFKSNGNHAFVSFDRIAIGCALNYNSPIVIGNTQEGFIVYIRNDLINIHKQFQKFFLKSSGSNYDLLNTLKDSTTSTSSTTATATTSANFILNQELYTTIDTLKGEVKASIIVACQNLNIIPVNDITYQNFLINHFIELNVFQLFSNLNSTILDFNETEYNDKIKKIYNDELTKIKLILENNSLDITYTLTDISTFTDITSIITTINDNINIILAKIEEKYNEIKGTTDIENYDAKTDVNHNIYLKIQTLLKLIEKIVIDINEIQKLFLSNIESMRKIIQHQSLIIPLADAHTLDIIKLKQLPKGIASNIITCTPYIYCQTNSKPIRNADIFFERSTSIFGTTTVILQIFNIFNCNKLNKLKTRFVQIIYNTLDILLENATLLGNASFLGVIGTVREQFIILLMPNPTINLDAYDINLVTSPAATSTVEASTEATEGTETTSPVVTTTEEADAATTVEEVTAATIDTTDTSILAMRELLKTKKLFIIKPPLEENIAFNERVDKIRNASGHIEELFTSAASSSAGPDKTIQIAYENEVFIKGFIGLFAFMSYTEITGKKVPKLFTTRQDGNQANILKRLFEMLYLNISNISEKDTTVIQRIQQMKQDIFTKLPQFSFDEYTESPNKKEYIKTKIVGVKTRKAAEAGADEALINTISLNIEKYINYCTQIETAVNTDQTLDTIDSATDTELFKDKSDFTVYSFRKLLELNIITVDDKPLTDKFNGINANEINANMALLYFIENRIATMNKEPIPHPELIGLFQQLFAGSGLYSQEYNGGNKVGGGNGLFDTMYDLFVSNDDTFFKEYRKNSYLLLNMPTNYEITISNFQSYPPEIRSYFQNLNRQLILKEKREKEREEQMQKMKTMQFSGPGRNLGEGIIQPQRLASPIETFGGNTKKNIKKNKKTKRKIKNYKNKTRKHKQIKKIRRTRKFIKYVKML
jgi:hypothetical protein